MEAGDDGEGVAVMSSDGSYRASPGTEPTKPCRFYWGKGELR